MPKRRKEKDSYIFRSKKGIIARRIVFFALVVLLIPSGYFIAKQVKEGNVLPKKQESSASSSNNTPNPDASSNGGEKPDQSSENSVNPPDNNKGEGLLAFYLPLEKVKNTTLLTSELEKAKAAGLNAVVFDLKDNEGNLLYASETEMVKQTPSIVSENALTLDEVRNIISKIENAGFVCVPRIFAFKDHKASWIMPSAKVTLEGQPEVTWLDESPTAGGKAWLNPYAPDAHKYISDLAAETASLGAKKVILDGIQFPNQTHLAYYGKGEMTNLSKNDVLKALVQTTKEKVSAGCELIVSFPVLTNTKNTNMSKGYADTYGDPASFGGSYVAPDLMLSKLGNSITIGDKTVASPRQNISEAINVIASYIGIRIDVMAKPQPALMPWLEVSGYSKEEITSQLKSLHEARGAEVSMIFYDANGIYDFGKIDLAF